MTSRSFLRVGNRSSVILSIAIASASICLSSVVAPTAQAASVSGTGRQEAMAPARKPALVGDPVPLPQAIRQPDSGFDLRAIRRAVVPDEVRTLVAQLADDDWSVREAATRAIHDHEVGDEALLRVLDHDDLGEEQRQRLLAVMARRIRERERGAIGIRMNRIFGLGDAIPGGVEVADLIDGLPATRVLQLGDIIVRIDDRDIFRNEDLIEHVQRLAPGNVIHVSLLRPRGIAANAVPDAGWIKLGDGRWFEPIVVDFALGSHSMLGEQRGVGNPETARRERQVQEMRSLWGRAPRTLNGQGTIDGVVPPENATPPGAIRRLSP